MTCGDSYSLIWNISSAGRAFALQVRVGGTNLLSHTTPDIKRRKEEII